jgi:hypothetical protein
MDGGYSWSSARDYGIIGGKPDPSRFARADMLSQLHLFLPNFLFADRHHWRRQPMA